ncbi:class I SAM-dependent methyltransferase [Ruminococcaceae bacterium OttesenSCG-928-I18]|nr:class I SAM-dependent methyltransferase [Ruminococcaceae bacterium OttesenSCG-928-I18]
MNQKKDNRAFWSRYANLYDFEIDRFNRPAYAEMYSLISNALSKEMRVLEIATGTGLVALHIAASVHSVEAIDFAPGMIKKAKKKTVPPNVHFSVGDATALSFAGQSFDAVIISNALHIMPDPALVLENIRRVLKPAGLLIAPTFSHGHLRESTGNVNAGILKLIGFETYSKWTPEEYVAFVGRQGFSVSNWRLLKAAFPLVYLEARLQ